MQPYTPAWAEKITGVPRDQIITVAREFAQNAEKTKGRSMVIVGAGLNHWYHMDMNYRGIINMLVMCGCVGQSGGGWSHYVGQEKLRPQSGWLPLAFGLDLEPPAAPDEFDLGFLRAYRPVALRDARRVRNSFADRAGGPVGRRIDRLQCARRTHGMAAVRAATAGESARSTRKQAAASGLEAKDYVAKALKSGALKLACDDPDNPQNWPRNLFVWRSNLLGASGKGHEYFLKHLLGTKHGVMGKDLGEDGNEEAERGRLAR